MKIKFGLIILFFFLKTILFKAQVPPTTQIQYNQQKLKKVLFEAVDLDDEVILSSDAGGFTQIPQWNADNPVSSGPVCYVSGATPKITATFDNCQAPIYIKGKVVLGSTELSFPAPSTALTPNAQGQIIYGPQIPMVANSPFMFPEKHIQYIEDFSIEWKMCNTNSSNENDWTLISSSSNPVYLTYKKPEENFPYHTVIHLGCTNANGINGTENTEGANIVNAMFTPFLKPTFNVRRVGDNKLLTYYSSANGGASCLNLQLLLSSPDGDGKCGAFGELFYRMIKDQGLTDGIGNAILPLGVPNSMFEFGATELSQASIDAVNAAAAANWPSNPTISIPHTESYFLVKNWSGFAPNGFILLPGGDFDLAQSAPGDAGIKGQGNVADPRSIFPNHVYIHYDGKIYDPSYGVKMPSTSVKEYEDVSLEVVSGAIILHMEGGGPGVPAMPRYYFWVENVNIPDQLQMQSISTMFD